jgi:hypothetical protein
LILGNPLWRSVTKGVLQHIQQQEAREKIGRCGRSVFPLMRLDQQFFDDQIQQSGGGKREGSVSRLPVNWSDNK